MRLPETVPPCPPLLVGRPVVVVVDAQRDWELDPAQAGIAEPAAVAPAVAAIERVLAAARTAGTPVIFCQEVHRPSGLDYGRELDHGEPLRCVAGETTTDLPQLDARPQEPVVVKRRCSGFFGTELDLLLRAVQATTIVLVGGLTDVCVHATFLDAFQHGYVVRVVEDACVGSSGGRHEAALDAMTFLHRGARCDTDEIVGALALASLEAAALGAVPVRRGRRP